MAIYIDRSDGRTAMLPPKPEPKPRVELCGMRGGVPEPFTRCADCHPETEHHCYWLEQCEREQSAGFAPEDYAFTTKLLRQHTADAAPKLFQAVCSNNLNIILAALDAMGDEP